MGTRFGSRDLAAGAGSAVSLAAAAGCALAMAAGVVAFDLGPSTEVRERSAAAVAMSVSPRPEQQVPLGARTVRSQRSAAQPGASRPAKRRRGRGAVRNATAQGGVSRPAAPVVQRPAASQPAEPAPVSSAPAAEQPKSQPEPQTEAGKLQNTILQTGESVERAGAGLGDGLGKASPKVGTLVENLTEDVGTVVQQLGSILP